MGVETFFYSKPVFLQEEFVLWKKKQGTINTRAIQKALLYYRKAGRLLNVRRGLYAAVPPNESPQEISVDPYLIAGKASRDSILAYHTALELHGVAYSVFEQFTFVTTQKNKPFEFQSHWFQPSAVPAPLQKANLNNFGIERINRQGVMINVTNIARTYVDVLDRIELSGGWEEVIRSIENIAILAIEEVIEYCLMLNNRVLAAKVGFFLEQRKGAFKVEYRTLKPLLKLKPLSPQYISPLNESSQLIKNWNLIIPTRILKQTWNEPDHDI